MTNKTTNPARCAVAVTHHHAEGRPMTRAILTLDAGSSPLEVASFPIDGDRPMAAVLGGIDALVFCGGIGENSRLMRARICERLAWMGIEIDHSRNAANEPVVSSDLARTTVMVIPTNEELGIARGARAAARSIEEAA
jgi:hypothetical protein